MTRRHLVLLPAGVALALALGSCGGPVEPVTGVILPATGRGASYGKMIREGMDLALQQINDEGGVGGQPLRLIYKDSATDPATGVAAAHQLVDDDHVASIIGAVSSSVTRKILAEVTDPARVILLSPAASSPALTGRSVYFFRVHPSDVVEGGRMAELMTSELHLHTLVVFAVHDEYGAGYKKALLDRFRRKKNREVLKVFNVGVAQSDFSDMVDDTAGLTPDAIYLIGYDQMVADVTRALRKAGVAVPIFCSGSITDEFPARAGVAAEGVVFSRPDFRATGNLDEARRFTTTFMARYGRAPGNYAAYGYDAVRLLTQVMRQGHLDSRDMLLALRSPATEYTGVTGNIVFGNAGGDVVAVPTIYIIRSGAAVPYARYLEEGGTPPGAGA
ncbi:MAG: ABC transporter substrate-binding protein [Acidobacteriota bacterium]